MSRHDGRGPGPCELLVRYVNLLPTHGRALDLACGLAGNALLLAGHGLQTTAVDDNAEVLARAAQHVRNTGLGIELRQQDAALPLRPARYDVITVSRFLERGLAPAIERALKPGGLLCYQTFSVDVTPGRGPGNRDYLLKRNELLRLFPSLVVLAYHEALIPGQAGLVAYRPS